MKKITQFILMTTSVIALVSVFAHINTANASDSIKQNNENYIKDEKIKENTIKEQRATIEVLEKEHYSERFLKMIAIAKHQHVIAYELKENHLFSTFNIANKDEEVFLTQTLTKLVKLNEQYLNMTPQENEIDYSYNEPNQRSQYNPNERYQKRVIDNLTEIQKIINKLYELKS